MSTPETPSPSASQRRVVESASEVADSGGRYPHHRPRERSEAVAATLRERGLEVEIRPMRDLLALDGHRAVVLGAPFYLGRWHKDARRFLSRHREALTGGSVAVFALGPLGSNEQEAREARGQLDDELKRYPWLTPVAVAMFGGRYDPAKLGFAHKVLVALPASPLHELPASDLRNWDAIRAWANELAHKLGPAAR